MLKIQKFLKNRSIEDLRNEPFNLHINADGNLLLFKYNQFNSDFSNEIVKECRGIILENGTWEVVCHPFHKFFNLGEVNAYNSINLSESIIFEKVDGSIIKVYYYNDKWNVATNGTINAKDASTADGISFNELFFDIISVEDFNKLTDKFNKENTYLFELIHPASRIVVDYEGKKELVFIGMIKNENFVDYNILSVRKSMDKIFKDLPIRYPKVYDLNKLDDINELTEIADRENENGNNFEGFVVAHIYNDSVIGRVKIKSPKYINLHHIATGESVTNNLIEVLLKNEMDEFEVYLSKLPNSLVDEYNSLKNKYFSLIKYLYEEGELYREKSKTMERKELALDVLKNVDKKLTGFIFKMVDSEDIIPEDLLAKLHVKKLKNILI